LDSPFFVRILSWNTAFGRGTAAAIKLANNLDVDAVLLQEAAPGELWQGTLTGDNVPGREWGSWVLLRHRTIEPIPIDGYAGWVSGGRWLGEAAASDTAIFLFSVHSPTPNATVGRRSYVAESRRIVSAICEAVPSTARLVIGGDFNFKSFGNRIGSEVVRSDAAELEVLAAFRSLGLSNVWQDCHPGEPLPQTLRWKGSPSTPYHCDGFLMRGWNGEKVACEVMPDETVFDHSDHNPVLLEISLRAAG
jgi:endonuclease/exonuclease/phosphatase family protein